MAMTQAVSPAARLEDLTDLTPITETTGADPDKAYDLLRQVWGPVAPVELEPGLPAWLLMDYRDVCEVLRDDESFSRVGTNWRLRSQVSATSGLIPWVTPRPNAYNTDGEQRRRLRAPFDQGLESLDEHPFALKVRAACTRIMDDFRDRGSADLMTEYGALVTLLAFADLFGIPEAEARDMVVHTRKYFATGPDAAQGLWDLLALLRAHIAMRRDQPAADLTTMFIGHPGFEDDDASIANAMSLMIVAGYEQTTAITVQALVLMLSDRRFAHRLRAGRLDVDLAIEEVLWRQPPTYNLPLRFAMRDVELGGRLVRRGDAVVPSIYASHLDPSISTGDPWLEVGNRAHLTFGTGVRTCPGQRVGRIIARTAVQAALDDLPSVRLALAVEDIPRIAGSLWSRYPTSLPVAFEPRAADR